MTEGLRSGGKTRRAAHRKALEKLRAKKAKDRIEPRPSRGEGVVLSYPQQRLWFLDQMLPDLPNYNVAGTLHMTGRLDIEALLWSLGSLVRRQESLRTTFAKHKGRPLQMIREQGSWKVPMIDLSGLPAAALTAGRIARAEAGRLFDLERGPLLRNLLLRIASDRHTLVITIHHIVSDGWSSRILVEELTEFYQARREKRQAVLPELPIQYADFAIWQRRWLQKEKLEAYMAFWRGLLAGRSDFLQLPTDRPRPAALTLRGRRHPLKVPEELTASLARLARDEGMTLFVPLLATFQLLLHRWSLQDEILVGTPLANRRRPEVHRLIGFFVNVLPIPSNFDPEVGFRAWTRNLHQLLLEIHEHQELPLEKLVEELSPERTQSHAPLVQVNFGFANERIRRFDLPDLAVELQQLDPEAATVDLMVNIRDSVKGDLNDYIEYSVDLFDATSIARLARHYLTLLEGVLEDYDAPLRTLSMLERVERQQLLGEWTDTGRASAARSALVPDLVEAWAAGHPESLALVSHGCGLAAGEAPASWSYGALNERSNRLAHTLRSRGVGPDSVVAVGLERSPDEIVSLLAVLKAGGAYLPLDLSYPRERLEFILADGGVSVLITRRSLGCPIPPGVLCVDLEAVAGELAGQPASNPRRALSLDHLAYVVYTSGSTGRPKGVAIPHRGLSHLCAWHLEEFSVTEHDRASRLSGLAFDGSVWELWPYLICGASMHLPPDEETRLSPVDLRDWLVRSEMTCCFVPTPMGEALLGVDWPDQCRLRLVKIGGDKLQGRPPDPFPWRLSNNYGPAEGSVVVSSGLVGAAGASNRAPSLGRAISNLRVYVLDRFLQPVALGASGQLYFSSPGLARGYLGRPALTAERFIPDPFSERGGERLYQSGDLIRYLTDGRLEFLERLDHLVKIRGFSIELGEIEAALHRHAGVRRAVVLAREASGQRRLVAYVVAREGVELTHAELSGFLQESLPSYMVPGAFVMLDQLPLTPNGKVDRRALPVPEISVQRPTAKGDMILPRDELELELARMWSDILGLPEISINDSFFDLGGHSLLAMQVMARVEKRFGRSLPIAKIFEGATIEEFAELLREEIESETRRQPLVRLQAGDGERPFYCVHPVGGNVFCYVALSRAVGEEQTFYGLQSVTTASKDSQSIEEMARIYVAALREGQPKGPYHLGGWSIGAVIAFEMAHQLQSAGETIGLLAMLDPPAAHQRTPMIDEASLFNYFASDLLRAPFAVSAEVLQRMQHTDRIETLLQQVKKRGVLPESVDAAGVEELFEIFRNNLHALRAYQPKLLADRIEVFRVQKSLAGEDLEVNDRGWGAFAESGSGVHPVPGNHYTFLQSPLVEVTAQRLQALLSRNGGVNYGRSVAE